MARTKKLNYEEVAREQHDSLAQKAPDYYDAWDDLYQKTQHQH